MVTVPAAAAGYAAAGVLPFRLAHDGSVLLLLALEERALRGSPPALCWHPVGGRREAADGDDPFATAAREWREETGAPLAAAWLRAAAAYALWLPGSRMVYALVPSAALADAVGGTPERLRLRPTATLRRYRWFEAGAAARRCAGAGGYPVSPLAASAAAAARSRVPLLGPRPPEHPCSMSAQAPPAAAQQKTASASAEAE
jgi:8-oxo-dGTP pyrophosphatase MutT (NUDIX family)